MRVTRRVRKAVDWLVASTPAPLGSGRRRYFVTWVIALMVITPGANCSAQMFGAGASPGRGSYRPPQMWNGPFFSAPHMDPWAPRPAVSTGLISTPALNYSQPSVPHGSYGAFQSEGGAVQRYEQGFSPYSGYADWYKKAYKVEPTAADIVRATREFFRSSPIPPDPRTLAPEVNRAFAEVARQAQEAEQASNLRQASVPTETADPKVAVPDPKEAPQPALPKQAVIYRGVGSEGR